MKIRNKRRISNFLSLIGILVLLSGCTLLFFDLYDTDDLVDDNRRDPYRDYGEQTSHKIEDLTFDMRLAPSSSFPIGQEDERVTTVEESFWIAETQVTYELWYKVKTFAKENGYTFANRGREGGDLEEGNIGDLPTRRSKEPVTTINWRDSIVWCNALTEYHNELHKTEYQVVYMYNNMIIKDATDESIPVEEIVDEGDGFRLPRSDEWELAARYQGSDDSYGALEYPRDHGSFWTPGNYASGATADYQNNMATREAAWYYNPYSSNNRTQDVGQRPSVGNGLGLYDMSGNVWEWCSDGTKGYEEFRILQGGSWYDRAPSMQIGYRVHYSPSYAGYGGGFRVARSQGL